MKRHFMRHYWMYNFVSRVFPWVLFKWISSFLKSLDKMSYRFGVFLVFWLFPPFKLKFYDNGFEYFLGTPPRNVSGTLSHEDFCNQSRV